MDKFNFRISFKCFMGMLIGNIILGLGIAIFKFSFLGNDPFSAMMMALSSHTPLSYAALTAILNTFIFIIELILGKRYIGLGTLVNWVFLAYFVTFFNYIMELFLSHPEQLFAKIIYLVLGVIIVSFGVSLYQASDSGIAPYDSLSLIMEERTPVPYFWCRLITDIICTFICFLAGGLLGIGTLTCALCLGPFVHFFNKTITFKVMGHAER